MCLDGSTYGSIRRKAYIYPYLYLLSCIYSKGEKKKKKEQVANCYASNLDE